MRKTNRTLLNLLEFISNFYEEHSYYPTIREMAHALKLKSTCTISYYLARLEECGLIKRSNQKSRAIEILKTSDEWYKILDIKQHVIKAKKPTNISTTINSGIEQAINDDYNFVNIPLIGDIAAGQPILAIENCVETYKVPTSLFGRSNTFMLNVHGDSMIDAGIYDGDKIVVSPQNTASNGEIIVALINDSATVKRFYKENNYIRLQPENKSMEPIIVKDIKILGKVIGLIRNNIF